MDTRGALTLSLACLAVLGACRREAPSPGPAALEDALAWKAPAGWSVEESSTGPDRAVHMSSAAAAIRIQLLGGRGSMFERPERLLASLGERSVLKASPGRTVGGREAGCWSAAREVMEPLHPAAAPAMALAVSEELCVVAAGGGRYLVVAVEARGPAGGPAPAPPAEWEAFLGGLALRPVSP